MLHNINETKAFMIEAFERAFKESFYSICQIESNNQFYGIWL